MLRMLLGISIINPLLRKTWSFQHRSHLLFPLSGSCHKPVPACGRVGEVYCREWVLEGSLGAFQNMGCRREVLRFVLCTQTLKVCSVPSPFLEASTRSKIQSVRV